MSKSKADELIRETYFAMLEKLKIKMGNAEYVCTTADIWSYSKRSFFGYTGHWMDAEIVKTNLLYRIIMKKQKTKNIYKKVKRREKEKQE